jgi:hypothetical protein
MRGRSKRDCAVRMPAGMRARGPPASRDGSDPEPPSAIEEGAMLKTTAMLICLLVIATGAEAKKDRNRVVMDFATMYGVDEAFVGANPIRDLVGDELPWEIIGGVHERLTNRGHLRIRVRGLVFTHNPALSGRPVASAAAAPTRRR